MKRWLSTFVEKSSPAALQVVAEDLDERMTWRMRCSHDLVHQRGGTVRIGDCTAASRERMVTACNVPASVSSHRAALSDSIDWFSVARGSRLRQLSSCKECKLETEGT